MKLEEIGYAGKCGDREFCVLSLLYAKIFLKINKDIPFYIFPFCPFLEDSMRRVHKGVLY